MVYPPCRFGGRARGRHPATSALYSASQSSINKAASSVLTNIYVDGFNLYYGCLKGTPHKWLNILKMCQLLLPRHNISQIKYFTALVSARPNEPDHPMRQQTYLRALRTLPNLSITYGQFLSHPVRMRLANPPAEGPATVQVIKTEEKGSDVNLATALLVDGFLKRYEVAVVISNDSDLCAPIDAVTNVLGLTVGILNPHKRPSRELAKRVKFMKTIRTGALRNSQFPTILTDAHGSFSKPSEW
jgi:hypothetical protein